MCIRDRYYLTQKRWSFRKSLFELKRKGIDEEAAAQALSDCGISAKEQIRELIEQKYYRYLGDQKGSQKAVSYTHLDVYKRQGLCGGQK